MTKSETCRRLEAQSTALHEEATRATLAVLDAINAAGCFDFYPADDLERHDFDMGGRLLAVLQDAVRQYLKQADNATARIRWEEALTAYQNAGDDEARSTAEDNLMAVRSPSAAAFAFKINVARGGGRETDCWDDMLADEAARFAKEA